MTNLMAQVGELGAEAKAEFFEKALSQLTVAECLTLVKHLEKEWEVEATPSFSGGPPPPPPEAEEVEQTEFSVGLKEYGQKKIAVVKAVRVLTNLSLKDSKTLVDKTPIIVQEKLSREDAEKAKSELEAAGATVEIR
jgi:large subunit ribosomal protein L7/L12